jgi:hypothetical protein
MAQNGNGKDEGVPAGAIAAGVLSAGAAAAAGYYFYGAKHAKQHRKEAAKWAHDAKREIVKEAKRFQGLGEEVMHDAIDRVAERYQGAGVDKESVDALVKELKANWRKVRAEATGAASRKAPAKGGSSGKTAVARKKKAARRR